jgi:hypothetical protein
VIRQTLPATKEATWAVFATEDAPPHQVGTCFVIDPAGFILTANHVIEGGSGRLRSVFQLQQPRGDIEGPNWAGRSLGAPAIVAQWPHVDLALLKVDLPREPQGTWLEGRTEFPFLELDFDVPEDGTPVYCYGYPLPKIPSGITWELMKLPLLELRPG